MDNKQVKQEFDATAEKYGGQTAYNQAKESGKTALTYKQWVQVRTPSFKAWFGDWENDTENASKVVNPDTGEPQVVYHGTTNQEKTKKWNDEKKWFDFSYREFTVFKRRNDDYYNSGHFFASDMDNAGGYGSYFYEVFINLRNPLIIDCKKQEYVGIEHNGENHDTYEWANIAERQYGNDGVIFKNIRDGVDLADLQTPLDEFVAFNSEQIKSATDNIGTFDRQNPDIRYDLIGLPENDIDTDKHYLDLVHQYRNGDLSVETELRQMVNTAAAEKGYAPKNPDEINGWTAPAWDGMTQQERWQSIENDEGIASYSLEDIAHGYSYHPLEMYEVGSWFYRRGKPEEQQNIIAMDKAISEMKRQIAEHGKVVDMPKVTVYRAVPKNIVNAFRNVDFVYLARDLAVNHGEHALGGEYSVQKMEVPANQVWSSNIDIHEFGVDDGKDLIYKNVKNNRKSNALFELDDSGNVIPLSQRFNEKKKDIRFDALGLPEFSGSVSAYFNNPKRQELVLAFLKTAERSKDLRSQAFLNISYEEQKQFNRIAAFSPLELSAILDCKPEFANNMREYIAVVEDFERNHQQKLEDFKKALQALKISPKYQAASIRNRIFEENDLRAEYIDGGKAFAFTKTGEITNGDRLKQVIANAIDAIAPAVKYALSQTEFWQERDDLAFIVRPQIQKLLADKLGSAAQFVEVKTLYQAYEDDPTAFDGLSSKSVTSGFYSAEDNCITVIADAFIKRPEMAVWTAYHELGHRGIELQGYELWADWLQQAVKNPTVRSIANTLQSFYASKGLPLSDIQAAEEALVEVFAAYKTQNWDYLAQRHNLEISQEFKKPQGTAEKLWNAAKNRIGQIFGRQSETVSDAAVFAMLGKLEQSLYQFPEWTQRLQKTISSARELSVNPTALTNRYRSGDLRFDLNVADDSEFATAVDRVAETRQAVGKYIRLGTTPDAWKLAGIPHAKISINDSAIRKVMGEHLNLQDHEHDYSHIHNILPETLKQLPEQLNEPIAVLKSAPTSTNPDGYIVLTELLETDKQTGEEKFVVAALNLKYDKNDSSLKVIDIPTVFGRDDWQNIRDIQSGLLKYWDKNKGQKYLNAAFALIAPPSYFKNSVLVNPNVKTNEDLMQYQKDKEMKKVEERYYANTPKDAMPYKDFVALWEEKNTGEKMVEDALKFMHRQQSLGTWQNSFEFENSINIYSELHQHRLLLTEQTEIKVVAPFEWNKDLATERFDNRVSGVKLGLKGEQFQRLLPKFVAGFEKEKQEIADFFGIPKEQVAEFLGREEPKELLEQARQIIKDALEQPEKVVYYENRSGNLCEIINNPEKDGYYLMSDINNGEPVKVTPEEFEKDWVKNDLPKLRALAQAFKNLELPDREYVYIVEFQDKPESEIIAALAWDEVATAVKDYVNSQSDENTEKLRNAYLAYPIYNELASKGIPDDEKLRRDYGKVVASEYSSFDERRTAALFVLQSVWNGRGNSTSITRSYNIDAMSAYIARTQPQYFDSWDIDGSVNERFLTKNSIFTHKNLREMGLDNNSNLAPYAPELLQEMVKIEEQYGEFSQWQNPNSEGGWFNRGAENIIDFKQIPAAVQKDLILMVTHTYPLKRGMFGVYDNPVIGMQHGLAARSEVQSNLEKLIEQQEKEWQQYQKVALGVSVPQENAIVEQINLYKQTLEQVKNAPAVAFVPEKLFVVGETKPDWRTGEVQRYKTTEINTKTGEITFVNDPNNPNPNPFGDMTEQARQYLSANNNFAMAALGVAPKEMPENMKFDLIGNNMKQNETVFEFNNGCTVIISDDFADNIDKNGNGDFDNEAQLLHKNYTDSIATYHYCVEGVDDNTSAIHLFDYLGRKDFEHYRHYEVDLSNPNWKEDLAKAMVDFAVSKELIAADKQQPVEIVKIITGDEWRKEVSPENSVEKPRLGGNVITLNNGYKLAPVISAYADKQLINADFVTATKTLGERFPINGDDYRKFENHQSQANFFYCFDTNEVVIFAESPNKESQRIFNIEDTAFYGLKDFVQELKQNQTLWQVERQRIEKREEIFDILFAVSSSMSNVEHENPHFRANNIWANYGNMSLMYGRFDEKTGDFKYRTYGGDDIFVINTDKISARTAATAFLRGVDEYKEKFVYGKSTALTPKKRRDIQSTVDFSIAENRRMEDISSYQDRRERLARIERQYAERETQKQTAEKSGFSSPENMKFDDFGVPENGNAMKIDTSLPIEEQYKLYQLAEERISRQYSEASIAVLHLQGKKGISGFNPERLEKAIAEESKFAKQLDDLRQANPEFALMARAKHLDPKDLTPELRNELQRVNEWVESQKQAAEIKQDAFGVPETPKTLNPKEQALADGKAMTAADEKVGDAKWELDKQPNNPERQAAYKQAIAEREELHNEIKQRVSAAMDKGEPYVIRYDEVPAAPFNGEKAPIELVVTQKGNLRLAIGTLDKPHNLTAVDSTPEFALNTEQRSSPERTAEVLRERFNQPTAATADRIACINYPADKVFSGQEIKDALNKALKSPFKTHQLAAIHSPRMKDEWLKGVVEKHSNPEVVAAAHKVLAERQALSSSDNLEPEKHTANKGGLFLPEHEEEPATVADDDGYERD